MYYFEVQLTLGKVRPVATHSHPVTRNRIFNLENEICTKNMEAGTPTRSIFQSAMAVHQDVASTMVISSLNQLLGDLILPKHGWQQWVVYLNPPISFGADIYPLMTKRDSHYVIQRDMLKPFKAQTSSRSIFERVILIIPKVTGRIVCLGNFFRPSPGINRAKLKLSTLAGSRYLH